MILVRELTDEEVAKVVSESLVSIGPTDALCFYHYLLEAMRVPMFAEHQDKDGNKV